MLKIAVPRLYEPMTAYDFLLGPVTRFVREDPKRMRMGEWINSADGCFADDVPMDERPICGTVCCIGGWTEMLVNGRQARDDFGPDYADRILGLNGGQANDLFYGDLVFATDQDTPAHAERVIAHIADFCDMHHVQLKATTVVPT